MWLVRMVVAGVLTVTFLGGGTVLLTSPATAAIYVDDVPASGWRVNGRVLATEIVGDTVYVGGRFTEAISPSGTRVARRRLAAFSMTTGALLTGWRADADATVTAIASDGQALFVGGEFGMIGNVPRARIARLGLAGGAVDPAFEASADSTVRSLEPDGGSLFVGGRFLHVNGATRRRIAKVSATTGTLDQTFRVNANAPVFDLVRHPSEDIIYAAGQFWRLNGVARAGVGGVDSRTGATTGPAFASSARPTLALDVNEDGTRLFGAGGSGTNTMAAWDTGSGTRVWRVVTMGDNQATKYFRGTVFVGFHDGYRNDHERKVLAIDARTGVVDPDFRPRIPSFWGVFAIDASELGVVIGGDFSGVSGVPVTNLARFAAGEPPPPPLLSPASDWAYWDRGTRPTAWESGGFDDSAWPRGAPQLGYGDGDEATVISFGPSPTGKYISSYFRARFTLTRLPQAVRLSLLADDGAVVYVNGVEALRDNMPAGTITNTTRAATTRWGSAESVFRDFDISPTQLREGQNTIAVEVHQDAPASSDVSFDLRLTGLYPD